MTDWRDELRKFCEAHDKLPKPRWARPDRPRDALPHFQPPTREEVEAFLAELTNPKT
jgi:hypothetical protein